MQKAYKYRISPTKGQQRILNQMLEECRYVYNQTLAARRAAWEQRHESLRLYATINLLPAWKAERPSLKIVHSQVLQHVQVRVDLAFKAFFRRVKAGEQEVGYPRFKGYGRYDTITYPKVVSRIYERIANRRSDFAHRLSRKLVNRFGIIAFEDLNAQGMLKNHCLAKSIADAAWDQLVRYTTSKAAEAGRRVVLVDPRNTSKRCSRCGQLVPKDLSVRVHACPVCGLVIDRDENAAINILALGLQCLGASP